MKDEALFDLSELGVTVFAVGALTKELLLEKIKNDEQVDEIVCRKIGDRKQYYCSVRGTGWRRSPIPA